MFGEILIVVEHVFETIEVETISDVLLIDFAEKLVIFEIAKPADPAIAFFRTIGFRLRHRHCGLL